MEFGHNKAWVITKNNQVTILKQIWIILNQFPAPNIRQTVVKAPRTILEPTNLN
jgi:hypothetical protein